MQKRKWKYSISKIKTSPTNFSSLQSANQISPTTLKRYRNCTSPIIISRISPLCIESKTSRFFRYVCLLLCSQKLSEVSERSRVLNSVNLSKIWYFFHDLDSNSVSSLEELSNLVSLSYISGNNNRVNSLKGLENIKCLTAISLCIGLWM